MTLAAVTNGPRALDVVGIWSRIGVSLGQWKWAIQENGNFTHHVDNRPMFKTHQKFYVYKYVCNYQYKKNICTEQCSNHSECFMHIYCLLIKIKK